MCETCGNFVTYAGDINTCKYCLSEENKGKYRMVRIPYASKQVIVDLMAVGMKVKLKLKTTGKNTKDSTPKIISSQESGKSDAIAVITPSAPDTKHSPDKMNLFNDLEKVLVALCSTTSNEKTDYKYSKESLHVILQYDTNDPQFIDILEINNIDKLSILFVKSLINYSNISFQKVIRILKDDKNEDISNIGAYFSKNNIMKETALHFVQSVEGLQNQWICYSCRTMNQFPSKKCISCGRQKYFKQELTVKSMNETISTDNHHHIICKYATQWPLKTVSSNDTETVYAPTRQLQWSSYSLSSSGVKNMFDFMFNKIKKIIYIEIKNNRLKYFIPFSNIEHKNRWFHLLNETDAVKSILDASRLSGYPIQKDSIKKIEEWHAYNCLVQYLKKKPERFVNDDRYQNMEYLLLEMCRTRKVGDVRFFVNLHDFFIKVQFIHIYSI